MKFPTINTWKRDWLDINQEEQERERWIFIIYPWHADTMQHVLAHTLIGLHNMPLLAFRQIDFINEEQKDNYKIVIPRINPDIIEAINELNMSNDLIQILTLEDRETKEIIHSVTGEGTRSHLARMMQQLEIEDKIQENIMELSNNRLDLDYDFSSLLDQEEPRTYHHKYAKKFHQKTQGKINTKWFPKYNYHNKK